MIRSVDRFLNGQLHIRRVPSGFCSGSDAVFLASYLPLLAPDAHVLDVGCGSAAAGLCVAAHQKQVRVTVCDVMPECITSAQGSITDSGMQDRVTTQLLDVNDLPHIYPHAPFDAVITNPPYFETGTVRLPAHPLKQAAMVGVGVSRTTWLQRCAQVLKPQGVMAVVFPASEEWLLYDILHKYMGGIEVFPLFPREHLPASRVLWRAVRGSKTPLKRYRGLVLHPPTGDGYTPQADAILRGQSTLCYM